MPINPALERSLLPGAQAIADAAEAQVAEG
jgi:hypothetical protein